VEAAWGLKPSAPPHFGTRPAAFPSAEARRPTRAAPRRAPPSPVEILLRLVIDHPAWAARIPWDLIPADHPEGRALVAVMDAVDVGDLPGNGGLALVMEHFRHSPHAEVLGRHAGTSAEEAFDEQVVETLFQDTLDKLRQAHARQEFAVLTDKARMTGLSPEELARYRDLLRAGKEPAKPQKVSDS